MPAVSFLMKGAILTRYVRAICMAKGDVMHAAEIAGEQFGEQSQTTLLLRSAVAPGTPENWGAPVAPYNPGAADYLEVERPRSIPGRLALRVVPLGTRVLAATAGTTATFVGPGQAISVGAMNLTGSALGLCKVGVIVAVADELVRSGTPAAEKLLRDDLTNGTSAGIDLPFIDPSNAGVADVRPKSITHGVAAVPATSDFEADLDAMYAAFTGDEDRAVLIMTPSLARKIRQLRGTGGDPLFPGVSARGGDIEDVPVITSKAVPSGVIVLADPGAIEYGDEGVTFEQSNEALLQMSDSPDSPPTSSTLYMDLWQHNCHAVKAVRYVNWRVARSGAVQLITGANY